MKHLYSFMERKYGTKEEAEEIIKDTDKEVLYTHGLGYRNPTIHKVPISKEEAINKLYENSLVDVDEYDEYIHVNSFSGNDMW